MGTIIAGTGMGTEFPTCGLPVPNPISESLLVDWLCDSSPNELLFVEFIAFVVNFFSNDHQSLIPRSSRY
jgi:hypothetical protein